MSFDVLTMGEALVEILRTDLDEPLAIASTFVGPYASGAPFIFAAQSARLGLRTAAIGCVGDDAFGHCIRNQMQVDDISMTGLHTLEEHPTGIAFVSYQSDGSRNFLFSVGASGQLSKNMIDPNLFSGLKCLHIMGSTMSMNTTIREATEYALDLATQNNALISFDPNIRPELLSPAEARDIFRPFIDVADILIPTEDELLLLTNAPSVESAIDILLLQRESRIIAVTRGARGCQIFTRNQSIVIDGYPVTEVDPTGAGDCFDAGLIYGVLNGLSLEETGKIANACGANAVLAKGPMTGAQFLDKISHFITQHDK